MEKCEKIREHIQMILEIMDTPDEPKEMEMGEKMPDKDKAMAIIIQARKNDQKEQKEY